MTKNIQVAVLDDYQQVALKFADWSAVRQQASITVFSDHLADEAAVVKRLLPFQVICIMRERTRSIGLYCPPCRT